MKERKGIKKWITTTSNDNQHAALFLAWSGQENYWFKECDAWGQVIRSRRTFLQQRETYSYGCDLSSALGERVLCWYIDSICIWASM